MPQCKLCGKKGIFLSLSELGLCQACHARDALDVGQKIRINQESAQIINNSKNMKTRLSRLKLILDHLNSFWKYEEKGIRFLNDSLSNQINYFSQMRYNMIIEGTQMVVDSAMSKAEVATSPRTSVSAASKALLAIKEAKEELPEAKELSKMEDNIRRYIHKTTLDGFLEAARKAAFKGQAKKAIDQYKEALFFLHNDEYDDSLQEELISEINEDIKKLEEQNI